MKLLCIDLNYRTAEMSLEAAEAGLRALARIPGGQLVIVDDTWAANTATALGLLTFKLRAPLQGKADSDPTRYWRDFVHYNFLKRRP